MLRMFHGTQLENYHSILRCCQPRRAMHTRGMCELPHTAHCSNGFRPSHDGMLGAGVYVSRQIEKAYAYGPQKYGSGGVVIELLVRVGRTKKIDRQGHPLQKSWHDAGCAVCYC